MNTTDDRSSLRSMTRRSFEDVVVPHLDAAFNYARWLTRNDADAEDLVRDAVVHAFRFFSSVRTNNARSWPYYGAPTRLGITIAARGAARSALPKAELDEESGKYILTVSGY